MSAGASVHLGTLPPQPSKPSSGLGILYEHPRWFEKVFEELDRRGVGYEKLHAPDHFFDLSPESRTYNVLFNRMSPSAYRRDHGSGIYYTLAYLAHLESLGTRVINGSTAFRYEVSKALQLSLLRSLGLRFPKARVIHDARQAVRASEDLRFPVVVKPNVGGSGAGIVKFETREKLAAAARAGDLDLGLDHAALVQEFVPARGEFITRVETLGGRYLYAIQVHLSGETFDLCPADICQTTRGEALNNGCVLDAAKAGLQVEAVQPPSEVIRAVEATVQAAHIDVGGIEFVVDDRDGEVYYYDVNALSNFVADAPRVVGFDPFVRLVDYILQEVRHA